MSVNGCNHLNNIELQGIGMTSQRVRDRMVMRLREQGIRDDAVLAVMSKTPRHIFVDDALSSRAYDDDALPIGYAQTISAPSSVALMTQALLAKGNVKKVLEVGTGSGYQAAILAQLVDKVYSVERISALQDRARERYRLMSLTNVQLMHSDGSWGWPTYAPYDAIIVTAAPEQVPEGLLEQLAVGGVMIIPVGGDKQALLCIEHTSEGFVETVLDDARFVPMLQGKIV